VLVGFAVRVGTFKQVPLAMSVRDNVFILNLRQQVIFPAIRTQVTIQPQIFTELCEFCEKYDSTQVGVIAMKPNSKEGDEPELYEIGTYCRIASHSQSSTKSGDQEVSVVTLAIEGQSRFQVLKYSQTSPYRLASIKLLEMKEGSGPSPEVKALMQNVEQHVMELMKDGPPDRNGANSSGLLKGLFNNRQRVRWPSSPSVFADMIAAGLPQLTPDERQQVLETLDLKPRLELVLDLVQKEVEVQKLSREIGLKRQKRTENDLRKAVLQRQMQELQREMRKLKGGKGDSASIESDEIGDGDEDEEEDDISSIREALKKAALSEDAKKIAARELKRLQNIQPQHPEYTVCRTYLETLSNLPWSASTKDDLHLRTARDILDKDHYGLEKVKRRILEFLAVQKMRGDMKGPILCLHGPPGVGKTSLGRSVAKAMGRKFHRMALGGVRDEAELRGHRRTYIGSMPGSVIQALIQLKVKNPVILLDEVDKLTHNAMYNPSAALLELLDPEQNHTFKDHYINTPFDLSQVLFLCTCNDLASIDRPLLDRMEVIDLSGYTVEEKVHIATTHLLPKQRKLHALEAPDPEDQPEDAAPDEEELDLNHGPSDEEEAEPASEPMPIDEPEPANEPMPMLEEPLLVMNQAAISELVSKWTMEAGVRNLERRVAQICRWAALRFAGGAPETGKAFEEATGGADRIKEAALAECGPDASGKIVVEAHHLPYIVGAEIFEPDLAERLTVGVSMGLSVSSVGGQLLFIEATRNKGTGRLTVTGQLGEVMRESVSTAMSLLRSKLYSSCNMELGPGTVSANEVFQQLSGEKDPFSNDDIHVHFPAGGIPKDGPSAGVATTLALASLLLDRPVRSDTAVTGEITLRGHVLPVGGIRDKVLAAHRAGVRHVLLPYANQRHVKDELPDAQQSGIEIHYVKHIDEALTWAFADNVKTTWPVPVGTGATNQPPAFAMMSKL
jgi:ATP-dependent Lon protease